MNHLYDHLRKLKGYLVDPCQDTHKALRELTITGTSRLKNHVISVDRITEAILQAQYCKVPDNEVFEISGDDINFYPVIESMVSGKYSALSGAIAREQSMANIAANLSNVNTTGYKKTSVSFESLLQGAKQVEETKGINYSRTKGNFTDFTPGPIMETGNPLDMAIHGDGFFKVQGQNGILYTRRGDFTLDRNGDLRTSNGMQVLNQENGPINIPNTATNQISVSSFGEISIMGRDGSSSVVGTIGVVTINDPGKLKREADTTFSLPADGQETVVTEPILVIGNLETSNVNMTEAMTLMIDSLRTFETYHKVLKSYSDLSQKQDELGSLA